jgi:hypothetical protein
MFQIIFFSLIVVLLANKVNAQCFCSFGNPSGSEVSSGVLEPNTIMFASYYRFSDFNKLYKGDKRYSGDNLVADRAYLRHFGFLAGYGITQKLSIISETGYYLAKSQIYNLDNLHKVKLTGHGLSNSVLSLKHRLHYDVDNGMEISWGLGADIPFSRDLQKVDGVTLPIEVQPSLGSYGLVFHAFIYKEDVERRTRYYFVNRINKFFENKQNITWGTFYSNSLYFSKHVDFYNLKLRDWTFILQLNNQIKAKDSRNDQTIHSSGNFLFFIVPQVNLSINAKWNFSVLASLPLYQYYNEIQLGESYSLGVSVLRYFQFY